MLNTQYKQYIHTLTSFSESPLHLLTIEDAEMLKKVVLHSVATALANNVFPVPLINGIKACIVRRQSPKTLEGMITYAMD